MSNLMGSEWLHYVSLAVRCWILPMPCFIDAKLVHCVIIRVFFAHNWYKYITVHVGAIMLNDIKGYYDLSIVYTRETDTSVLYYVKKYLFLSRNTVFVKKYPFLSRAFKCRLFPQFFKGLKQYCGNLLVCQYELRQYCIDTLDLKLKVRSCVFL